MANSIASMKRKGRTVVNCALVEILYHKGECLLRCMVLLLNYLMLKRRSVDHILRVSSMLRQQKFLKNLLLLLENDKTANEVVANLNRLRGLVTESSRMRVHTSASVRKLRAVVDPVQAWMDEFMFKVKSLMRQK